MHNNMSSLTACNQLTQQPSSTSCKQAQGDQLKSVPRSVSLDSNKTLPVNAKRTSSRKFLSFFPLFFNVRQCTKSTQSVFLSIIYHSLNPTLFTRSSITWLLIPIYSTTIPSERFFYQNICICWVLMLDMSSLTHYTIFLFSTLTILNEEYKLWSQNSCNFVQSVYHRLLRA